MSNAALLLPNRVSRTRDKCLLWKKYELGRRRKNMERAKVRCDLHRKAGGNALSCEASRTLLRFTLEAIVSGWENTNREVEEDDGGMAAPSGKEGILPVPHY